mgnify:CR=1 FL=1
MTLGIGLRMPRNTYFSNLQSMRRNSTSSKSYKENSITDCSEKAVREYVSHQQVFITLNPRLYNDRFWPLFVPLLTAPPMPFLKQSDRLKAACQRPTNWFTDSLGDVLCRPRQRLRICTVFNTQEKRKHHPTWQKKAETEGSKERDRYRDRKCI